MRHCLAATTFLLAIALPAYSQIFSLGVKAGVPLTSAPYVVSQVADGAASAAQQRFTVGPTAEIHLPFVHLSVEVDALWRHSSINTNGGHFAFGVFDAGVNEWQIPLLAKYEISAGRISPFVDAGPVFRYVTASSSAAEPDTKSSAGISVSGGMTFKLLHFRLEPEIRYTRWLDRPFSSAYAGPFRSTSDQADLLVGFTF